MKLPQRLAYYGFGLLVGSMIVYFIWQKKNTRFDYMPNARVLKDIRNSTHQFSENALKAKETFQLDSTAMTTVLFEGSVNFDKSKPREKPCKTYVIESRVKQQTLRFTVKKCDSISTFEVIEKLN
ncbi:hypothetical protein KH5_19160 [Urechidicola sp. KH5]